MKKKELMHSSLSFHSDLATWLLSSMAALWTATLPKDLSKRKQRQGWTWALDLQHPILHKLYHTFWWCLTALFETLHSHDSGDSKHLGSFPIDWIDKTASRFHHSILLSHPALAYNTQALHLQAYLSTSQGIQYKLLVFCYENKIACNAASTSVAHWKNNPLALTQDIHM